MKIRHLKYKSKIYFYLIKVSGDIFILLELLTSTNFELHFERIILYTTHSNNIHIEYTRCIAYITNI